MSKLQSDKNRLRELRKLVAYHRDKYHHDDAPEISDEAYDALLKELKELEVRVEGEATTAETIGAAPSQAFKKVKHRAEQWSFDNVFAPEELTAWLERLSNRLEKELGAVPAVDFVCEHKIDGLKIVLEYERGEFRRAATRGDGVVGEDVTHTAVTIKSLPKTLTKSVSLTVVGEVWLGQAEFALLNERELAAGRTAFANPRNAAAGSLRQLDPAVAASRALSLFVYDIDWVDESTIPKPKSQWEELELLRKLGFPVNPHAKMAKGQPAIQAYYESWLKEHETLPYAVDGIVIKLNDVSLQSVAGYTAKSPRFGVAYKFPAVETTTVVESIEVQVGRTGIVTPVAHLRPVLIDGSTVARATLHNEDQIKRLDVRVGDTVILRKAGDVIPEVVSVLLPLRPKGSRPYVFPKQVSGCGGDGSIERIPGTAAYRCVSLDSELIRKRKLYYFVSKTAFNIDGVGPRIIDQLLEVDLIGDAADLFALQKEDFLGLEGFKDKSAENAVEAIKAASKVSMTRILVALGLKEVGEETARLLAERFENIEAIRQATEADLLAITGVGPVVVDAIIEWQGDKSAMAFLAKLLPYLEVYNEEWGKDKSTLPLQGKSFVFTGTLESLARDEAEALVRVRGGSASGSVSAKTSYVVVGGEPGSKAKKAVSLGVTILTEADFLKLIAES